jgi:uncharacterized membrane protein YozB (DUF420 family)
MTIPDERWKTMTATEDKAVADRGTGRDRKPGAHWLRRSWVVLFAVYCLGFGVYGGYRYVTLDQSLSRVAIRPDVPLHYPLLTAHVLTGVVAVSLAWLQVWPWLRDNHPRVHRRVGWTYFLAGVIPSGLLSFPVAVLTPAGQSVRATLLVMGVLWVFTTAAGLRAVLQHRYEDHRRWMLRNVALTTTIITSRILSRLFIHYTFELLPDTYRHQRLLVYTGMSSTGLWLSIVLHLGFVEWYLLRPRRRRSPAGARPQARAEAGAA